MDLQKQIEERIKESGFRLKESSTGGYHLYILDNRMSLNGNVLDFINKEVAYKFIRHQFNLWDIGDNVSDYVKKEDVKHTLDDILGAEPLCQDLINLLESKEIAKKRRDSIFELKQAIIESLNLVK